MCASSRGGADIATSSVDEGEHRGTTAQQTCQILCPTAFIENLAARRTLDRRQAVCSRLGNRKGVGRPDRGSFRPMPLVSLNIRRNSGEARE